MKVRYVLFAVTEVGGLNNRRMEFIEEFDDEIQDDEVEELIRRFRPDVEYDYVVIEKQYYKEE